jgi:hypothetical protein
VLRQRDGHRAVFDEVARLLGAGGEEHQHQEGRERSEEAAPRARRGGAVEASTIGYRNGQIVHSGFPNGKSKAWAGTVRQANLRVI